MKYPEGFEEVARRYEAGELKNKDIAAMYGVSRSAVSRWVRAVGVSVRVVRCKKCGRLFERGFGKRSVYCSLECGRKRWSSRKRYRKYSKAVEVSVDDGRAAMMARLAARDAEYARLFPEQAKRSESKFVVSDNADAIARMVRRFQ